MKKEKNVVAFYVLCNRLKDVIRSGWKNWKVTRERVESVAEHIYGTQMLALAMWSEFEYSDIDIMKVVTMLALHELEETVIGDLTMFEVSKDDKTSLGHKAVENALAPLLKGNTIKEIIFEFDERKTKEAQFAFFCDKLECDLQCKLYDEQNCVDLNNQQSNSVMQNAEVCELFKTNKHWSEMWLAFSQNHYPYDDNFLSVSHFAKSNKITKLETK